MYIPFFIILFTIFLQQTNTLTGLQLKDACHCDLITNFCDFNCCCDTSCSTTIDTSCFYAHSSQFCIQTEYYYKVSPQLAQTSIENCYYFNSTQSVQQQVNISTTQVQSIISNKLYQGSLPDLVQNMYEGYTSGNDIGLPGIYLNDVNGNCITTGSTTGILHTFKFKQNIQITCLSTTNSINLFSQTLGKTINKYYLNTQLKLTIPMLSVAYTQATIYFILGTYGSQKLHYVDQIRTTSRQVSGSTTRTLRLKFIDPKTQVQSQASNPSFFPQIPYDIFFPIQQYFYQSPF